ncbi:MAG TPA: ABC transporter substrate-binding protein [Alphaproteobacteria bacterium]|nr:ABC transporter substrate-binding protein [Alphaproteobacteria bacterium]
MQSHVKFPTLGSCLIAAAAFLGVSAAHAADLTITSFGGVYQHSQDEAIFKPFEAKTGIAIKQDEWNGELGKVRAMVQAKSVTWDLVDIETAELVAGCDEGLFDRIDLKAIHDPNDFVPGGTSPCGVATAVWANVFAYDNSRIGPKKPRTSADFFDIKTWPGKRGLHKTPKNVLEFALMADGVKPVDVYKVLATEKGVDRAFRKLDTIKKDIVWWEAGAQPMQLLADGQVVMTTAYGGRVWTAIHQDKKPFVVVWHNQIYDMDWWAIPKGAPHKKTALEFIKFASEPSILKNQSKWVGVGPAVKSAIPLVDKSIMKDLPTDPSNLHDALSNDAQFWADHFDSLNQRFQAWLAK